MSSLCSQPAQSLGQDHPSSILAHVFSTAAMIVRFDKYMNVVLADCEEFRKIKSKGRNLVDKNHSRDIM